MKLTKGIMALEGLEEAITPAEEEVIAPTEVEQEEIIGEVEDTTDEVARTEGEIAEGEAIAETVDTVADGLEASVERGEGLEEPAAEITNAALEHFYGRLGYKGRKGRAKISLEGFDKKEQRLANTKAALEELNVFRPMLENSLNVAQEGFFDRLVNGASFLVTSRGRMAAALKEAVAKYEAGTPRQDPIVEPGWSGFLNPKNASSVDGASAVAAVNALAKESDVFSRVEVAAEKSRLIVDALSDTTFIANDASVKKIKDAGLEVKKLSAEIAQASEALVKKGGDATFKPLQPEEVKRLASAVDALLKNTELQRLAKTLGKHGYKVNTNWANQTRLIGMFAADLRAARGSISDFNTASKHSLRLASHSLKTAHAAIKYIAASTGSKAA